MMTSFNNILVDLYLSAPINKLYAPMMVLNQGESEITQNFNSSLCHSKGFLHGSVLFKLLDDAAYFACQSLENRYFMVTSNFNIHFIRPVNSGTLISKGSILNSSTNQFVAESTIYNSEGVIIAKGSGTFVKSNILLDFS